MELFHMRALRELASSWEYIPKMGRDSGLAKMAIALSLSHIYFCQGVLLSSVRSVSIANSSLVHFESVHSIS